MAVFSMTILSRPSMIAGVRCSIRLRSHSYSCSLIDERLGMRLEVRVGPAEDDMRARRHAGEHGAVRHDRRRRRRREQRARSRKCRESETAQSARPSSTAAGSSRCCTPGMPCSGQGKPWARTSRAGGRGAARDLLLALVAAEHADHQLRPVDRRRFNCHESPSLRPASNKPFRSKSAMPIRSAVRPCSARSTPKQRLGNPQQRRRRSAPRPPRSRPER